MNSSMRYIFLFTLFCLSFKSHGQRPPIPNLPTIGQEEAGFNREAINVLYDKVENTPHKDFVGLVVIKQNQIAIEWYFNTFWRQHLLDVRSTGKSITSLLLGVAIKEGLVESLDQDVYSFFPKEKYPTLHEDFKQIKIQHLLDMGSGLHADTDDYQTPGHAGRWIGKDEWVSYLLSIPLAWEPGEKWVYADINAVLVGAIIEETSGMSLRDFAKKHVFDPLGITEFYWYTNASNQTGGAGNLYLSTLDFAKFGVLVANEGKWGNKQIVDSDYIKQLIARKTFDLTDYWKLTDSYGMLWYKKQQKINDKTFDYLWASGRGGNQLIVVPEEELVIALTSTAYGPRYGHSRAYEFLLDILGAVE